MLFHVTGPVPVGHVEVDLMGDGRDPEVYELADGRRLAGVLFTPKKAGSYWVQVRVTDVCGHGDSTAVRRAITVK